MAKSTTANASKRKVINIDFILDFSPEASGLILDLESLRLTN